MENEGFGFPGGATDFKAKISSFFAGGFAGGEIAGDELGQILTSRLAGDFEDRVAPAEASFRSRAFFEDREDLGGWISDEAEALGEVGDFHGGRGGAGGGFENKAKVIGGGKFESSAEVDRVGPDGLVGAIHDLAFRFGHQAFGGDFGGHAGEGILVDAAAGFLFSFGKGDGAKDGAEDGSRGKNFIWGKEEIFREDDAIVFDFERKGEAEGGFHLWIPFCGIALGKKSKAEKESARSFRKHGKVVIW